MSPARAVRRRLAFLTALVVATLGPLALTPSGVAADQGRAGSGGGTGKGQAQSRSHGQAEAHARGGDRRRPPGHATQDGSPGNAAQAPGRSHAAPGTPRHGSPGNAPGQSPGQAPGHAPGAPQGGGHGSPGDGGSQGPDVGGAGRGQGDPAGNNGTVKIAPYGDVDGIPQNTPHPGCRFQIEWYGFDKGDDIVSEVGFTMLSPTEDVVLSGTAPKTVFVGGDPATGAGTATGFDGAQDYTLSFDGAPHPQQGYHVKLTIHTPDSQGADTKHKVFWVSGCDDAAGASAGGRGVEGSDVEVAGSQASTDKSAGTDLEVAGAQETGGELAVEGAAGADVPTEVAAGQEGALSGPVRSLAPLLLVLVAGALGVLALRRRARG